MRAGSTAQSPDLPAPPPPVLEERDLLLVLRLPVAQLGLDAAAPRAVSLAHQHLRLLLQQRAEQPAAARGAHRPLVPARELLGAAPRKVRRATAREQKGLYDEAKADLKKAAELAPDDKAVPKLMTRVDAQIARQKAKEKKMYGKMFG